MSPVDIVILIILAISTLIGVFRGFIREVLSLASWIVALYVAWLFAAQGAAYLEPHISQPALRVAAAFAGIFVIMLIAASILSYLLYRLLYISGISGMDRSLGAVFGIARGWCWWRRSYWPRFTWILPPSPGGRARSWWCISRQ